MLGQIAVTAGVDFGAASFLGAYLNLQFGFTVTAARTIGLFAVILLVHGLLNTFGVRIVAILNDVSVWWHVVGVAVVVDALIFAPARHQSASFVFTHFVNNTGWHSSLYVGLLSLLVAQYTFTGVVAVAWVTLITVLFMLPQSSPVTAETFNYAVIAVLAVLGFAATWWVLSARGWFLKGSRPTDAI